MDKYGLTRKTMTSKNAYERQPCNYPVTELYVLVYVIVWVAVVFLFNCASNAGRKLVIV